jgi:hypothetical protein
VEREWGKFKEPMAASIKQLSVRTNPNMTRQFLRVPGELGTPFCRLMFLLIAEIARFFWRERDIR